MERQPTSCSLATRSTSRWFYLATGTAYILADIEFYDGHEFYNQLVDRLLWVDRFRKRYRAFIAHLIGGRFTAAFLNPRIDNALCRMQPDVLADSHKRATNAEFSGRSQEARDFIAARRAWLTTWLSEPDPMD